MSCRLPHETQAHSTAVKLKCHWMELVALVRRFAPPSPEGRRTRLHRLSLRGTPAWSYDDGGIWVDGGCSGEFALGETTPARATLAAAAAALFSSEEKEIPNS